MLGCQWLLMAHYPAGAEEEDEGGAFLPLAHSILAAVKRRTPYNFGIDTSLRSGELGE